MLLEWMLFKPQNDRIVVNVSQLFLGTIALRHTQPKFRAGPPYSAPADGGCIHSAYTAYLCRGDAQPAFVFCAHCAECDDCIRGFRASVGSGTVVRIPCTTLINTHIFIAQLLLKDAFLIRSIFKKLPLAGNDSLNDKHRYVNQGS